MNIVNGRLCENVIWNKVHGQSVTRCGGQTTFNYLIMFKSISSQHNIVNILMYPSPTSWAKRLLDFYSSLIKYFVKHRLFPQYFLVASILYVFHCTQFFTAIKKIIIFSLFLFFFRLASTPILFHIYFAVFRP